MKRSAAALLAKARALGSRKLSVEIAHCYHYRGFRYGGFGNNLYEDYIVGLSLGHPVAELRSKFAQEILLCRPRTFGEALQIDLPPLPPWSFPWHPECSNPRIEHPADNPDIVCHVCDRGVLASHINREFAWLESAWASIRRIGYRPRVHAFIRCVELVGDSQSTYLVLDGNHRLSAIHAMGHSTVQVELASTRIVRAEADRWPLVLAGVYSVDDALKVFDRYATALNPPLQRINSAAVIHDEAPQW